MGYFGSGERERRGGKVESERERGKKKEKEIKERKTVLWPFI